MVEFPRLRQIALQKRWVAIKCEIYRHRMGGEIQRIKSSTAWVPHAMAWTRIAAPLLVVAAPLAGLRSKHDMTSLATKAQRGGRVLRLFNFLRSVGRR